jgi:hypothetical protein
LALEVKKKKGLYPVPGMARDNAHLFTVLGTRAQIRLVRT